MPSRAWSWTFAVRGGGLPGRRRCSGLSAARAASSALVASARAERAGRRAGLGRGSWHDEGLERRRRPERAAGRSTAASRRCGGSGPPARLQVEGEGEREGGELERPVGEHARRPSVCRRRRARRRRRSTLKRALASATSASSALTIASVPSGRALSGAWDAPRRLDDHGRGGPASAISSAQVGGEDAQCRRRAGARAPANGKSSSWRAGVGGGEMHDERDGDRGGGDRPLASGRSPCAAEAVRRCAHRRSTPRIACRPTWAAASAAAAASSGRRGRCTSGASRALARRARARSEAGGCGGVAAGEDQLARRGPGREQRVQCSGVRRRRARCRAAPRRRVWPVASVVPVVSRVLQRAAVDDDQRVVQVARRISSSRASRAGIGGREPGRGRRATIGVARSRPDRDSAAQQLGGRGSGSRTSSSAASGGDHGRPARRCGRTGRRSVRRCRRRSTCPCARRRPGRSGALMRARPGAAADAAHGQQRRGRPRRAAGVAVSQVVERARSSVRGGAVREPPA